MEKPKPTSEYEHGQMMGMLVIIQAIEKSGENGISVDIFDKIKRLAVQDLSEYLKKPEEDVHLMVDNQLKDII